MHLELNEGPTAFDTRHNFVVSGTGARAAHRRPERQLGGARAERHAVQPDQRQHRSGPQRHAVAEPLPAGDYSGTGADAYTVKNYKARAQRRLRPRLLQGRLRGSAIVSVAEPPQRVEAFVDIFNLTEPRELPQPDRQPGRARQFLRADRVQHELHAAQAADRRAVRVLERSHVRGRVGLFAVWPSARERQLPATARERRLRGEPGSRARTPVPTSYTHDRCVPAFRRLLPYVLRYRRQFVLGLVCVSSRPRSSCCRRGS